MIHPLFHVLFDAVDDKGPFSPDVAYNTDVLQSIWDGVPFQCQKREQE